MGKELGGNVVGADRDGIRVSLGGRGETVNPWKRVSAKSFVRVSAHYIDNDALKPHEKADKLFALALYCYEGGAFDPSVRYAKRAVELDAQLKPLVARHMPDALN
jgi:hypothetical protein